MIIIIIKKEDKRKKDAENLDKQSAKTKTSNNKKDNSYKNFIEDNRTYFEKFYKNM